MSWSGFKKNVGRATTQVMMKTGHVEKTADRGYEVEERRYRTLESASLRLQKEAKGYLDSLRAMTASQMRIAETIDAFYGDSGASDGVSRSYKQAVEDLDAETVKALDGPYRLVDIPSKDVHPSGRSGLYRALVDEDLLLPYLVDDKTGGLDGHLLAEIESEYYSTKRRVGGGKRVADIMDEFRHEYELIESVCRTTVLEPINRFCAYFPDINECIKKRNHKMLDYDAMRSKVKRLTEKPDKDASKLPRAEKEADMVGLTSFLDTRRPASPRAATLHARKKVRKGEEPSDLELKGPQDPEVSLEDELVLPAPDETYQRNTERHGLHSENKHSRSDSAASGWRSNVLARFAEVPSPTFNKESFYTCSSNTTDLKRFSRDGFGPSATRAQSSMSSSAASVENKQIQPMQSGSINVAPTITGSDSNYSITHAFGPDKGFSSTESLLPCNRTLTGSTNSFRSFTSPNPIKNTTSRTPQHRLVDTPYGPLPLTPYTHTSYPRTTTPPFFTPSELHEIMAPVKRAFVQQRANELHQAKAAYEQLNEQLSTELPQLIDLRVPYLDPSFEALVKIQLRFCSEAYSRMAQVQHYLDPATRDQYASGELDQKVEDVLGQIRELSIAGTV